jgi:hypothetical protein
VGSNHEGVVNVAELVEGILWDTMFSVTSLKFFMKKVALRVDNGEVIDMLHICS